MTAGISDSRVTGGPTLGIPFPGLSLATIASRCLEGCKRVNQAGQHDLQKVFYNYLIEHSSTYMAHEDKVPKTT